MRVLPDDQPWVFDLVSSDDSRRAAALIRHRRLLAEAAPPRAAVAGARRRRLDRTLSGLVTAFREAEDPAVRTHYAPYAVLFLRWEERFLPDLRGAWAGSVWTTKAHVLRDLTRGGVPEEQRPAVAELTVAALMRPYRCKDWGFAGLLRHLGPVEQLAELEGDRARFARYVLGHPELVISRFTYPRWLAAR